MRNLTLFTTLIFSCSHVVYCDSSFNIHNALNFVTFPGRTKLAEGRMRPGGRGLKTHDVRRRPTVCENLNMHTGCRQNY